MKEIRNYLVEVSLPDRILEVGVDYTYSPSDRLSNLNVFVERSVSNKLAQLGYTSPYGELQYVKGNVYILSINSGKLEKKYLLQIGIGLQQARMTSSIYNKQMDKLFAGVSSHIRSFIEGQAYDRGHSSGYEECYQIAQGLLYEFRELFKNLGLNLMGNKLNS